MPLLFFDSTFIVSDTYHGSVEKSMPGDYFSLLIV